MKKIALSAVLALGCPWEKDSKKRTYVNDRVALFALAGWTLIRYKTGNLKRVVAPDGSTVSNAAGNRLWDALRSVYYDHRTGKFTPDLQTLLQVEIVADGLAELFDDDEKPTEEDILEQAIHDIEQEKIFPSRFVRAVAKNRPEEAREAFIKVVDHKPTNADLREFEIFAACAVKAYELAVELTKEQN